MSKTKYKLDSDFQINRKQRRKKRCKNERYAYSKKCNSINQLAIKDDLKNC